MSFEDVWHANEGKAREIEHAGRKEHFKAMADDPHLHFSDRLAATGHAMAEKISEFGGRVEHEEGMHGLRHHHHPTKFDEALHAADAKSREMEHVSCKEHYKAIADDPHCHLSDRIASVGHVAAEKVSELGDRAEYERSIHVLTHHYPTSTAEVVSGAQEAKARELWHAGVKEDYKALARDPCIPIIDRIAAAGHAVSHKLDESAARSQYEANMEALRRAT
jgi:hypothetical protein